jgi:very-short-patch-repair endonuclease
MDRVMESRIYRTAAQQLGLVTRRQLLDAGLSSAAIGRRLRRAWLRRLYRGVYLVGPMTVPHAAELAAVLACGPDSLLSHLSAGVEWGFRDPPSPATRTSRPGTQSPPPLVDVTVVGANRGRQRGIRIHRVKRLAADERAFRNGIPITSPARTLIDLAGVVGSAELEAAVARAEREGVVKRAEFSALMRRHRRRPGIPALRAVLEASGGPAFTRSEAETRFLALIRQAGLPDPQTNVKVDRYEIDFLWPSAGLAVEVDGFQYHSSRPRFEGDRRRDSWLLASGIKVIRLSWRQIVKDGIATAVQVGQALVRAESQARARSSVQVPDAAS